MDANDEAAIHAARRLYADDECEIDEDASVSISETADGMSGAWVAAWLFVPAAEIIPKCEKCSGTGWIYVGDGNSVDCDCPAGEERRAAWLARLGQQNRDDWEPTYSSWRHGGWYVDNLYHPSGAVGCVSRNYADKKWRIACDPRPFDSAPTFANRDAAARGERDLIAEQHNARSSAAK